MLYYDVMFLRLQIEGIKSVYLFFLFSQTNFVFVKQGGLLNNSLTLSKHNKTIEQIEFE